MNLSISLKTNVFASLAWFFGILSGLGNAVTLSYVIWTLTLGGHSYAQADLGLFMILATIGTPILLTCGSMLFLGVLLRAPVIRISLRHSTPLAYLLMGNLGLVAISWLYLFFMP